MRAAPRPGDVAAVLATAARRLAAAGVPSPDADAHALLAHALAVPPAEVSRRRALRRDVPRAATATFARLIAARCDRVPLQHLTGACAFRRLDLRVGPGVFVPRPETEVVAGLVIDALLSDAGRRSHGGGAAGAGRAPVVVDLGTGSGAIALAVKDEIPCARVHAVEADPAALSWAAANVEATVLDVALHHDDARTALPDLDGAVDVVVSNPPYLPAGARPRDPEVAHHDPPTALYGGGDDGLDLPRAIIRRAGDLLRPGGLLVLEHGDEQGPALLAALAADTATWREATDHVDLTGRPRALLARRR